MTGFTFGPQLTKYAPDQDQGIARTSQNRDQTVYSPLS